MVLKKHISCFFERFFQREFFITINWPLLLAFVVFWSYGWQPIISRDALVLQVGVAFYVACMLSTYLILGLNQVSALASKIKLPFKDCLMMMIIAGIWIALGFFRLQEPISGDQFYYSLQAKAHELYIISLLENSIFFQNMTLKNLIHALDFFMLITCILLTVFLNRLMAHKLLFCVVVIVIVLGARFFSLEIGIGGSPHPPFQLFPIWFGTSILGLNEISLRFSQYIGLIACSGYIYWMFRDRLGSFNALVLSITVCSIPLYLHVASLVEGSGWTTLIMFILITQIIFKPPKEFSSWFGLSAIICIFTLMRLSAFLIFPIFIIFYLQQRLKANKSMWSTEAILLFVPLLVCMPFFVMSVTQGTPATYVPGEAEYIAGSTSTFNRLLYALTEGVIFGTSISAIGLFWLTFILAISLRDVRESSYLENRFLIGALFVLFVATFFSIRPVLWGVDRYKAEYLVPFIMLGVTLLLIKLYDWKVSRRLFLLFAFGLIVAGSLGFTRYPQYFIDPLAGGRFERQTEQSYDFRSALQEARSAGFSKNLILMGVTYGVMPQILSSYSLAEVMASKKHYDQFYNQRRLGKSISESIAATPEINMVLLIDSDGLTNKAKLINDGWISWKSFPMDRGNEIYSVKHGSK